MLRELLYVDKRTETDGNGKANRHICTTLRCKRSVKVLHDHALNERGSERVLIVAQTGEEWSDFPPA